MDWQKEMLPLTGVQRSLKDANPKRQIKFLVHIGRKDGIKKLILCGKIEE